MTMGVGRHNQGHMAFEYASLRILEVLARGRRPMTVEELRVDLTRHGFRFEAGRLVDSLTRLREQGLIETLVLADGGQELLSSVAITARGERKLRGIIRL